MSGIWATPGRGARAPSRAGRVPAEWKDTRQFMASRAARLSREKSRPSARSRPRAICRGLEGSVMRTTETTGAAYLRAANKPKAIATEITNAPDRAHQTLAR